MASTSSDSTERHRDPYELGRHMALAFAAITTQIEEDTGGYGRDEIGSKLISTGGRGDRPRIRRGGGADLGCAAVADAAARATEGEVEDVAPHGHAVDRATVRQRKTGRPVRFELTEPTREAVDAYLRQAGRRPGEFLFPGRGQPDRSMTTRHYARRQRAVPHLFHGQTRPSIRENCLPGAAPRTPAREVVRRPSKAYRLSSTKGASIGVLVRT